MTSRDQAIELSETLGRWPTPTELADAAGIAKSSAWEVINRLKRHPRVPLPTPLSAEVDVDPFRRRELLTSQYDGTQHHAIYPTGLTTLCGLDGRPDQRTDKRPDCSVCETTALKFDQIDSSMPAHWHFYKAELPAAMDAV